MSKLDDEMESRKAAMKEADEKYNEMCHSYGIKPNEEDELDRWLKRLEEDDKEYE
jgi:hypothetical protein